MTAGKEALFSFLRWATDGGLIRKGFFGRRPWIFTRRYYAPGGWRCPEFIWRRCWNWDASGKVFSMHLSYLHGIPQACRRFVRLLRSDVACAVCFGSERPWRRMMWYPLNWNASSGAYVCSDACWDRFDAARTVDGDDDE